MLNERLIKLEMKFEGYEASIAVGTYASSDDPKDEIKERFYDELIDLVGSIGNHPTARTGQEK